MHESAGIMPKERHDRTLYLTHQPQEGGHHTKGYQPILELDGTIDKGSEIAVTGR